MRALFVLLILSLHASILVSQEDKPFSYKDDRELFERVVRVEEALVYMQKIIDANAEQRDKRFEDLNKRFEDLKWFIGLLFVFLNGIILFLFSLNRKAIAENGRNIAENGKNIAENGRNIAEIRHSIDDLSKEVRTAMGTHPIPIVNKDQGQDAMQAAKSQDVVNA